MNLPPKPREPKQFLVSRRELNSYFRVPVTLHQIASRFLEDFHLFYEDFNQSQITFSFSRDDFSHIHVHLLHERNYENPAYEAEFAQYQTDLKVYNEVLEAETQRLKARPSDRVIRLHAAKANLLQRIAQIDEELAKDS